MEAFFSSLQLIHALQLVLVAVGLVVLFPSVLKMFKKLTFVRIPPDNKRDHTDHGLTDLVGKWECLRTACEDCGCNEAVAKLDVVFPLLVEGRFQPKPRPPNPDPQPEPVGPVI